jgi:hypothetical protein
MRLFDFFRPTQLANSGLSPVAQQMLAAAPWALVAVFALALLIR